MSSAFLLPFLIHPPSSTAHLRSPCFFALESRHVSQNLFSVSLFQTSNGICLETDTELTLSLLSYRAPLKIRHSFCWFYFSQCHSVTILTLDHQYSMNATAANKTTQINVTNEPYPINPSQLKVTQMLQLYTI